MCFDIGVMEHLLKARFIVFQEAFAINLSSLFMRDVFERNEWHDTMNVHIWKDHFLAVKDHRNKISFLAKMFP